MGFALPRWSMLFPRNEQSGQGINFRRQKMNSISSMAVGRSVKQWVAACFFLLVGVLSACGGGSGTPTVGTSLPLMIDSFAQTVPESSFGGGDSAASGADGSAGDGAALPNAAVVIIDNAGHSVTTKTDDQGYYRARIDGFTPPLIASVTRPDGSLWYSLSFEPIKIRGFITINLSGLTDKIASDVAVSAGLSGSSKLTPAILAANLAAIEIAKRKLALDLSSQIVSAGLNPATFDPLRVPFRPDRTGYDAVLDTVSVTKIVNGPTVITPLFPVGGAVTGLGSSSGLVLTNRGESLTIAPGSSNFKFANLLSSGATYNVTVGTQPNGAVCVVNNASGNAASANASSLSVVCGAVTYTLGGSVTGRGSSAGALTLNAAGQTLTIPIGANSFVFPVGFPQGALYAVTIQSQPSGLTCSLSNSAGVFAALPVSNVAVTCSAITSSLGGTVSGLVGNGLVLTSGGQVLPISAGQSAFTFANAMASGTSYTVTVQAQPVGSTCALANNVGVIANSAVTSVSLSCAVNSYAVGGTVTGLSSLGLALSSGGQTVGISPGASSFTFPQSIPFGSRYAVIVQAQPLSLTCSVSNGSGVMGAAPVDDISIACSTSTFALGGTVSGLTSSGLILGVGSEFIAVPSGASTFQFPTPLAFGTEYGVMVEAQPTGNTCSVSAATGMVSGAVTTVKVTCSLPTHSVGGAVSGYAANQGGNLILSNGSQTVTVPVSSSPYAFPIALVVGTSYNVSVQSNPSGYSCTLANGNGTIANNDVTNVNVSCVPVAALVSTINQ